MTRKEKLIALVKSLYKQSQLAAISWSPVPEGQVPEKCSAVRTTLGGRQLDLRRKENSDGSTDYMVDVYDENRRYLTSFRDEELASPDFASWSFMKDLFFLASDASTGAFDSVDFYLESLGVEP